MSILFICSWYPSRVHPDNGDFIKRHALVAAQKYKVTILHAVKDYSLNKEYDISIKHNGNLKEIIIYYKVPNLKCANSYYLLKAYQKGLQSVPSFDIIHLHVAYPAGVFAIFLKRKFGKPLVITEHATSYHPNLFKSLSLFQRFFTKKILQAAAVVLPVSKTLGNYIRAIVPDVKITVIPNTVDTARFIPINKPRNPKVRFLHLSNLLDEQKNISGILNVCKRLAEQNLPFEMHIGGNGDLQYILDYIQQHNLNNFIFPFGRLEHDEVPEKMNTCDCFVLFSNYENQPCVIAESFACGLYIISTSVGGIAEYFPKQHGSLIPVQNEDVLFSQMKLYILNPIKTNKLEIHEFAKQKFGNATILNQLSNIYSSLSTLNY